MIREGFYYDEDSFYLEDAYYEDCETDESGQYSGKFMLCVDKTTGPVCAIRKGTRVICNNAFHSDGKLRKVIIPESVVAIADDAFNHCQGIEVENHSKYFSIVNNMLIDNDEHKVLGYFGMDDEVEIPDGIEQFGQTFSNTTIKKITIPTSVKEIEYLAFSDCENLQTVVLPNTIERIGNGAFEECRNLRDIVIPDSVKTIGNEAFAVCCSLQEITIPATIEKIGDNPISMHTSENYLFIREKYRGGKNYFKSAVRHNIRTKSHSERFVTQDNMLIDTFEKRLISYFGDEDFVCIPNSIKTIGNEAFAYSTIKQITIPDSVTRIGDDAFVYTQLQEINNPDSVEEIGGTAFAACFSLKKVKLPKSLKRIASLTFEMCKSLQEINLPDTVEIIDYLAFSGCKTLKRLTIPISTYHIGERAFEFCDAIELEIKSDQFHIKNNILEDEYRTIAYIGNDVHIIIPNNIHIILPYTFAHASMQRVTIPDTVVRICRGAFFGCQQLEEVLFGHKDIDICDYVFGNCPSLKRIIVPKGSKGKFKKVFPKCEISTSNTKTN